MLFLLGLYLLISGVSLAAFVGLIVALPPTYFCDDRRLWIDSHPVIRWLCIAAKNLLGLAIVVLGVLLCLPGVPGQGLVTIAVGLMLLDFPGKRRLMLRLVHRPGVLDRLNWLRRVFGRRPLI